MTTLATIFLRTTGALFLIGIFGFGLVLLQFSRPPFDLLKLQRLHGGMTKEDVRGILGQPRSVEAAAWHYARSMAWPIVHVHFDSSGRFESYDYDY